MHSSLSIKVSLAALLCCSSFVKAATVAFPADQCHALSFRGSLLASDTKLPPNYNAFADIQKSDIFCVGDFLDINKPIYSNGGDVVIFTNHLRLSAPIDTRLYLDFSFDRFNPFQSVPNFTNVLDLVRRQNHQAYEDAYRAYYSECIDCRNDGQGHPLIPQLPSGLTPAYASGIGVPEEMLLANIKPGIAAPSKESFDKRFSRSGNLYIYAHELEIADNVLPPNLPVLDPPSCSSSHSFVPFILNTSGLRGGRGGAGTPSNCIGINIQVADDGWSIPTGFDCGELAYENSGGLNASGSGGGDAGSIFIQLVGSTLTAEEKKRLESISSADGGSPGPSRKLYTPADRGPHRGSGNGICSFVPDPGSWPIEKKGDSGGFIVVDNVKSTDALASLASLLHEKDARSDYDISELAARAANDDSLTAISFNDRLKRFLSETLLDSQHGAITALVALMLYGKNLQDPLVTPLFKDMDLAVADQLPLDDSNVLLLREIASFDTISGQTPLYSYLLSSGGLLAIRSAHPYETFLSNASRVTLGSLPKVLTDIRVDLTHITLSVAAIQTSIQSQEYRQRLKALNDALRDAEAKAQSKAPSFLADIQNFAKAAGDLFKAFSASDPSAILEPARAFIDAGDKLRQHIETASATSPATIAGIKTEIQEVQTEFSLYLEEARRTKEQLLNQQAMLFVEALRQRYSHADQLQARAAQFHDLLRLAVISHLLDPAQRRETLYNNLSAVDDFLRYFPSREPYFSFRDVTLSCSQGALSYTSVPCIPVPHTSSGQSIVIADDTLHLKGLPAYTVASSTVDWILPCYGLRCELRSGRSLQPPLKRAIGLILPGAQTKTEGSISIQRHPDKTPH